MPTHFEYETARFRIRPAVVGDLPALEHAVSSSAFPQDLPLARFFKAGELSRWLEKSCMYDVEPKLWSITRRSSQECIGQIALFPVGTPGTHWLSYWVAPECWAQGIAKECVATLLRGHAATSKHHVVVAAVAESNPRSISVLRGLGFQQTTAPLTTSPIPPGHMCFSLELGVANAA